MNFKEKQMSRMYVIVNKDMGKRIRKRGMTKCYQHVQATHAVAQYMLEHKIISRGWDNETLIVLGASQKQFRHYHKKIMELKPMSRFFEPDLYNELTAFAMIVGEKDFGIFKRLKLL
jgi:hypothetical protein